MGEKEKSEESQTQERDASAVAPSPTAKRPLTQALCQPRSIFDWLALGVAWWGPSGLSPIAPGTVGSLFTLPLVWVLYHQSFMTYWLSTLGITAVGFLVSQRAAEILQDKDPSSVVIDEVAGVLIACGFLLQLEPLWILPAWVLFRVLDITKWGWIDRVQYWKPPALGIMADDILAGLIAGVVTLSAASLS
ncbi:MAG: phosphatidylglycerophosphatase A [Polyangiaceae bacterium]|nr:phosphatidylglycerophosphatase A [Polyangiaceae bacterium]